jgi:hypothetical protein
MKKNVAFAEALEAYQNGEGIRRSHWKEGEHIKLKKGLYPIDAEAVETIHGIHPKHFEFGEPNEGIVLPCAERIRPALETSTLQKFFSVTDVLAQDWEII